MKVYNYNKDTKEFISETDATENPLEKGKYLIPANATDVKVNTVKSGYARVYNETDKVWEYIEDNRGTVVYDITTKQESKVDYLGVIKDGFTTIKPKDTDIWDNNTNKWVEDTEQLKEQARLQAKAIKDEALANNTYTLQDGSVYQFRISDAIYFSNAIAGGQPVDWILADNTIRNTTVAELQEIYTNGSAQIKQIMTDYTTALKGI